MEEYLLIGDNVEKFNELNTEAKAKGKLLREVEWNLAITVFGGWFECSLRLVHYLKRSALKNLISLVG